MASRRTAIYGAVLVMGWSISCGKQAVPQTQGNSPVQTQAAIAQPPIGQPGSQHRIVRTTGVVRAARSFVVQVPHISDQQGGSLTLTKLIGNGAVVHEGDILAQFDNTPQIKAATEAEAKYDDLRHQVEQKQAEHGSTAEKRASDLQQAQADLSKAELEIRKGPILSDIDRQKNEVKFADATAHVASLKKSNHAHDVAEAAEIHILELQRDRQKLTLDRLKGNSEKLNMRAPFAGMVALENVWRNGSMGHAQEGDQLWRGSPLLQIFDPAQMEVTLTVNEPDAAALAAGTRAMVHLDAYPDQAFSARYVSASPVAFSAMGSSIRTFTARFRFEQSDPHLLPDLSAAVDIELGGAPPLRAALENAIR